ncbi:exportin-T [Salvelinus sp. IW2-2015]|uniref:exportin-T n=1 Tax=Salvelinus sp. IW2-2015 TaxID=2691554 RepID=UPI0038D38A70
MAGFPDFIYKHIVPACFLAPLKPSFDLTDAQTVLTLSECALTLKMIHLRRGPEFIQYLRSTCLLFQVSPEIQQAMCQVLPAARHPRSSKTTMKLSFSEPNCKYELEGLREDTGN